MSNAKQLFRIIDQTYSHYVVDIKHKWRLAEVDAYVFARLFHPNRGIKLSFDVSKRSFYTQG